MIELTCGTCQTEFSIKLNEMLLSLETIQISCPCCREYLPQKMNVLLNQSLKADLENNGWKLCFDSISKNELAD